MVKKNKIYKKKKSLGYVADKWFFEGDLDTLIQNLQDIKTEYPEFNEFELVLDYDDFDNSINYELFGYRPETIIEKKDRLARQVKAKAAAKIRKAKAKVKKKDSELKQLKELMEKYKDELDDV